MHAPRLAYVATLMTALGCAAVNVSCSSTPTRESLGEAVDDSLITSKVKTALVGDPDVSARRINVETFRGTVQLSGFARSEDEIRRAGEVARNVRGVRAVKNDIRLREDQ
jgi:osmotically-inducible protein OsmY